MIKNCQEKQFVVRDDDDGEFFNQLFNSVEEAKKEVNDVINDLDVEPNFIIYEVVEVSHGYVEARKLLKIINYFLFFYDVNPKVVWDK